MAVWSMILNLELLWYCMNFWTLFYRIRFRKWTWTLLMKRRLYFQQLKLSSYHSIRMSVHSFYNCLQNSTRMIKTYKTLYITAKILSFWIFMLKKYYIFQFINRLVKDFHLNCFINRFVKCIHLNCLRLFFFYFLIKMLRLKS